MTVFEIYYHRENGELANVVPYNIFNFLVAVSLHKLQLYGINIVAVLISAMGYVLGQKYESFVEEISVILGGLHGNVASSESKIPDEPKNAEIKNTHHIKSVDAQNENVVMPDWTVVREDYVILSQQVHKIDEFMSPIIFYQVAFALQWICITIYTALTAPKMTVLDQTYALWAFLHLAGRIMLLILTADKITEQSKRLYYVLQNCPKNKYCQEIQRLERLLNHPVGFTGLRCFTLQRSLALSLSHVIFTIEIVMLQASGGNKSINGFEN